MLTLPWPAQASGLVPIVEPEVLLDGDHDIDRTLEVAQAIWAQTFKYMADNKVCPPGARSCQCRLVGGRSHHQTVKP